ncbi:low-density lipoprotein receptor class A domain-containing protein 3-like isoform X1 [Clupea harengus]|uniref:Low-density lipoprotein receptor class A domain-containing protein 3-like isoform X1 n=1 Tax=Clupea harengus TaxID=7950 RepID=A0A6P8F2A4_CLUHA|nr:low-density lipoprotein receptor class A domain-containing protein 3-like isoform X1 [Clupea harengus]
MACGRNKFSCDDGKCISMSWVCDGETDCDDMSDEICASPPGYIATAATGAVATTKVVGGSATAHHTVKPTLMPDMKCDADNFSCDDGKCISMSWVCDGEPDCDDMSDESWKHCASPPGYITTVATGAVETTKVVGESATDHHTVKPTLMLGTAPVLVVSLSLAAVVCAVLLFALYKWRQRKHLVPDDSAVTHIYHLPNPGVGLNDIELDPTGKSGQTTSDYERMDPIVNNSDPVYESTQNPVYQQLGAPSVTVNESIA